MKQNRKQGVSLIQELLGFPPLWEIISSLVDFKSLEFYLLFSGGPDSTALAITLQEFCEICRASQSPKEINALVSKHLPEPLKRVARRFLGSPRDVRLTLLHLNHRMRPEANEDAKWVLKFAKERNLNCVVEELDVPCLARCQKLSLEEAGRKARYALLFKFLRNKWQLGFTAHTLDDHAESVIFNIIEKTGFGGILGIAPVLEGRILRPFLSLSKNQIIRELELARVGFLTDESNLVPLRPRTFLRHRVLPMLAELNPKVKENILATSENLRGYQGILSWAMETIGGTLAVESQRLETSLSLPLLPNVRVHILDVTNIRRELLAGLSVLMKGVLPGFGFKIDWQESVTLTEKIRELKPFVLRRGRDSLEFHPPSGTVLLVLRRGDLQTQTIARLGVSPVGLQEFLVEKLSGVGIEKKMRSIKQEESGPDFSKPIDVGRPTLGKKTSIKSYTALFSDKLPFPLKIRAWKKGDRIKINSGNGTSKLSDVFTNLKIPRILREVWPIVEDGEGEVIWIPGLKRSGKFWVDERCDFAYKIVWRVRK